MRTIEKFARELAIATLARVQDKATMFMYAIALMLWAFAVSAFAADVLPDKSNFTVFNATPDADLRAFNTDRPPKANSPYTVDAGHLQYETDLSVFGIGNSNGVKTRDWTLFDPTFKLGLTNTIDAELQITPYESIVSRSAAGTSTISGIGDLFTRLKINVLGDDHGDVSMALLPYLKFTTHYFDPHDPAIYTLDEALTYAITPNRQIDSGGNFSLNGVAPRVQLYMGLSQRF